MAKSASREIPMKNYITAGIYIIISLILIIYTAKWYMVYQDNNLNKAIISDYLTEISYEEFPSYLSENANATVYVGIANDNGCRTFENTFKNIVDNYDLRDNITYLNITTFSVNNADYINQINSAYGTDTRRIFKVPSIVIFENGKIKTVLGSNLTKENTVKFLKKYEIINQ